MQNNHEKNEAKLEDARNIITDIKIGILSTMSGEKIWGRPMHCCVDNDDNSTKIWIFTKTTNPVVSEVKIVPNSFIGFADQSSNTYLSVQGDTAVSFNKQKMMELWSPLMRAWYPDGLDDPEMCLLEFEMKNAEIWSGPSSKIIRLGQIISSIVQGKEYTGNSTRELH